MHAGDRPSHVARYFSLQRLEKIANHGCMAARQKDLQLLFERDARSAQRRERLRQRAFLGGQQKISAENEIQIVEGACLCSRQERLQFLRTESFTSQAVSV